MKKCITCHKKKSLDEYYKHPQMGDGHLNKCKECVKAYQKTRPTDTAYEKKRNALPHRVEARLAYAKTEEGKERQRAGNKAWCERNPHKRKAQCAVSNAVRDGRLIKPEGCTHCGSIGAVEGHHPDYSQHLSVVWLCKPCHMDTHWRI